MKHRIFIPLTACILALGACTDAFDESRDNEPATPPVLPTESTDPSVVTRSDIDRIAKTRGSRSETRSASSYTLSTIHDSTGNPAIYVINYPNNGGFLLVSATKDYLPVLAHADSGNFDVNNHAIPGLENWKSCVISEIRNMPNQPEDSIMKYRRMWSRYGEGTYTASVPQTRGMFRDMTDEEYYELQAIMQDSVLSWTSKGYNVYDIGYDFFDDPGKNQQLMEAVQHGMHPLYAEAWQQLTKIVYKAKNESLKKDNFMPITWDQVPGYNKYFPFIKGIQAPAGCGPVAVGQVMMYHKYPDRYNWAAMSSYSPTDEAAMLLYEIAEKADASYSDTETSASMQNLQRTLEGFAYQTKRSDNASFSDIKENCDRKRPVITCGFPPDGSSGHAWVISGYESMIISHEYTVWTFMSTKSYREYQRYTPKITQIHSEYMNWGWGGDQNGFYSYPLNYTTKRDYIYNITPNKKRI